MHTALHKPRCTQPSCENTTTAGPPTICQKLYHPYHF